MGMPADGKAEIRGFALRPIDSRKGMKHITVQMKLRLICITRNRPQPSGSSSVRKPASPMYVCVCHGFTDSQVRDLATRGCRSVAEVYRCLSGGEPPQCGKCVPYVREMVRPAAAAPEPAGCAAAYAVAAE